MRFRWKTWLLATTSSDALIPTDRRMASLVDPSKASSNGHDLNRPVASLSMNPRESSFPPDAF